MQAALDLPAAFGFNCVEFVLPSATVRLLWGASEVTFDGMTFVGSDPTYGVLGSLETFEEGVNAEAPRTRISVYPRDTVAHALWTDPAAQFGSIRIWSGCVDMSDGLGAIVDSPQLEFQGVYDKPRTRLGDQLSIEIDVASEWELMFSSDQGFRLSPEFHKSIWPGELGFDFVTGVQRQLFWGSKQAGVLAGAQPWGSGSFYGYGPGAAGSEGSQMLGVR
jgi:hypothetical protein